MVMHGVNGHGVQSRGVERGQAHVRTPPKVRFHSGYVIRKPLNKGRYQGENFKGAGAGWEKGIIMHRHHAMHSDHRER